jgi:adenylylsulfate kinase-like enzyme
MKELSIVIAGTTGAGKSSVARAIQKALESHGIKVYIDDDEHRDTAFLDEKLNEFLGGVAKKTEVRIKTVRTNRRSLSKTV